MDIEHDVRVFVLGPDLASQLKRAEEEGWQANPSAPPVVLYHLIRPRTGSHSHDLQVRVAIDESKVHIVRDGKIIG